jgi:hypothetical protein
MSNEASRTLDIFITADCIWAPLSSGVSSVIRKIELSSLSKANYGVDIKGTV